MLSPSVKAYLENIQTFLVTHKLELEQLLTQELKLPQGAIHISKENVEMLGRLCRVEPQIDQVSLTELENRLRDTAPWVNFPNNLNVRTLTQLLNSTGISAQSNLVHSSNTEGAFKLLRDHLTAKKIEKVGELFGDKLIKEGADDQAQYFVDKENFTKKMYLIEGLY
jgi:hypothetical protein